MHNTLKTAIPISLISASALGIILTGSLVSATNAISSIKTPLKVETPYIQVSTSKLPAVKWGEEFIKTPPPSLPTESWKISDSVEPIDYSGCHYVQAKQSHISSHKGDSGSVSLIVDAYGGGQSKLAYNSFLDAEQQCHELKSEEYKGNNYFIVGRLGVATIGDIIIRVTSPDEKETRDILAFYMDLATEKLQGHCAQYTTLGDDDWLRAPQYADSEYRPYTSSTVVRAESPAKRGTKPAMTPKVNLVHPVPIPEDPIPEGTMEAKPAVTEPKLPPYPNEPSIPYENVQYRDVDVNGPGCGWEWAGLEKPRENTNDIFLHKAKLIKEAQERVNQKEKTQWESHLKAYTEYTKATKNLPQWNEYATYMNRVYTQWSEINDEREELKKYWDEYKSDMKEYEAALDKHKKELLEYTKRKQECEKLKEHPRNTPDEGVSGNRTEPEADTAQSQAIMECAKLPTSPPTEPTKPEEPIFRDGFVKPKSWQ